MADGSAATACLVHDRQARCSMLVEFSAGVINRLVRATARRRGSHDFFDAHFRSATVIRRHAATYVALGDYADQFEVFRILNHRRAAMTRIAHSSRGVCGGVLRRTATRSFDWFHHITAAIHSLVSFMFDHRASVMGAVETQRHALSLVKCCGFSSNFVLQLCPQK
jgi:hypothetical protein